MLGLRRVVRARTEPSCARSGSIAAITPVDLRARRAAAAIGIRAADERLCAMLTLLLLIRRHCEYFLLHDRVGPLELVRYRFEAMMRAGDHFSIVRLQGCTARRGGVRTPEREA